MEILIKASRISYGVMIVALGVQQVFYANFRPVILPPWPVSVPGQIICIYFFSAVLIVGGLAIAFDKKAKIAALILGALFILMIIFCQIPYEILRDPYYSNLGSWSAAMKELVFAGGAFVVAGSFLNTDNKPKNFISMLEMLIPFGPAFFCITMICFGIDHFLYPAFVSTLVPNWIPGHLFWTYFAGAALIASGIGIIFRIKPKLSAMLLAAMIFIWLFVLHIPRAIADPITGQGNEVSSVFEAFGFSGIAYLIALRYQKKEAVRQVSPRLVPVGD